MILVAGGTGHLGDALVPNLADRRLRILSRDPERVRARMPVGVEVVAGDVRIASSLGSALAGVDTVISAVTGFGPGAAGPRRVDLDGNRNLIAAAEAAGVQHFILLSIHGASPEHPMELYRAKFGAEQALQESGLSWTIIRPTVFRELWAGIVGDPLLKGGSAIIFGRGDNPINFVSVRDVAGTVERALDDDGLRGKTLEAGGPENLTLRSLVEVVAAAHGRPPRARHVPLPALRAGALLLRPFRPDIAGMLQAAVLMDTADMSLDTALTV